MTPTRNPKIKTKTMFDAILKKATEKVINAVVNWIERKLNADIDGDGDIGK